MRDIAIALLIVYALYGLLSPLWCITAGRWRTMVALIVTSGIAAWLSAVLAGV